MLKDYIWGGRNLARLFGRPLPPGRIAESWEIAAHPDGAAVVDDGAFAGESLPDLHARLGLDLIGTHNRWAQARQKFPLLVKLLDATADLSIQVHPDDDYALAHEGNELGKSEMWVVLHAEPDAGIILGVKRGTTPAAFRRAIAAGELSPFLHRLSLQAGDVVCVPAGTLHAILRGSVIAEIQQNSNTTYRVFDWNRQVDGRSRPLHVDRALDVINFEQVEPGLARPQLLADEGGVRRERLCANRYFVTERLTLAAGAAWRGQCDGRTLEIWGCVGGAVAINQAALTAVRFALLPAAMGAFTVTAAEDAICLRTYVAGTPA